MTGCSDKEKAAYQLGAQAQQQLDSGDLFNARRSIDKAIAERDDVVDLHLLKARIELAGKSLDAAFLAFYNAMSLDPVNQTALQGVAILGLQTGHFNEAESAATKLLTLAPKQPTALIVRGVIAAERRRYPDALAAANDILANSPTDESAVVLKTRALFLSGARDEARKFLAQAIELSGNTQGFARISLEMARAGQDSKAMLAALAELRRLAEPDGQVVLDEANVRYKTGDRAGAAAAIEAGLTNDKIAAEQRLRLIELWREYDPAAPAPGAVPQPSDGTVREGLARYLVERGRRAEASALLAGLQGTDATGLRARLLLADGQRAAARQLANSVVAKDTGQCDARIALADLALAEGDTATAVTNGQQAAAECASLADGWLITARAYVLSRQPEQVERVYRDALLRDPDDLRVHTAFVEWLRSSGRAGEAPAVVRHLVRYAPNRVSTWRLMASACTDQTCSREAAANLARAQASFVIDRPPGQAMQRGLFSSLRTGDAASPGGT